MQRRPPTPARPRLRLDHALLLGSAVAMTIGSTMSWIRGATRMNGNIDWTGLDDTGDGAILIGGAVIVVAWVRWRGLLEEIDPRSRWIPLGVAIAGVLIWIISLRKALYLSWFDLAIGARPQIGLWIAGFGVLLALAGGWLASQTRAESED